MLIATTQRNSNVLIHYKSSQNVIIKMVHSCYLRVQCWNAGKTKGSHLTFRARKNTAFERVQPHRISKVKRFLTQQMRLNNSSSYYPSIRTADTDRIPDVTFLVEFGVPTFMHWQIFHVFISFRAYLVAR